MEVSQISWLWIQYRDMARAAKEVPQLRRMVAKAYAELLMAQAIYATEISARGLE